MTVKSGPPRRRAWLVRVEDWILAGWVALAAPILIRLQGSPAGSGGSPVGVFDGGRPIDGLLGLAAVGGALACLALRTPGPTAAGGLGGSGAVGPFVGGLLLVSISSTSALGLGANAAAAMLLAAAIGTLVIRTRLPPAPATVRRALVTPYVLVTGTLFWRVIAALTGEPGLSGNLRSAAIADPQAAAPALGFLLAFSAVFYAMLVFAPRQIAEPEGGPVTWLARYAVFVAGFALGITWLAALGG